MKSVVTCKIKHLQRVTSSLGSATTLGEAIALALENTVHLFAPDLAAVFLKGQDGTLRLAGWRTASLPTGWADRVPACVRDCLCGIASSSEHAVYSADLLTDPRCRMEPCTAAGLRAVIAAPLKYGDQTIGVLGIMDTTPRRTNEEVILFEAVAHLVAGAVANAVTAERFERTIHALPDVLFTLDPDGTIVSFLRSPDPTLDLLPEEQYVGRNIRDILSIEAASAFLEGLQAAREHSCHRGLVIPVPDKHGASRWFELSIVASAPGGSNLYDSDLAEEVFLVLARDVTQQRTLYLRLEHADKMQTVGEFAAAIAHDFNNILTIIGAGIGRLKQMAPSEAMAEELETMENSMESGIQLCRSLLGFSRERPASRRILDLNNVLNETLPLLRRLLPPTITIAPRLFHGKCPIEATAVEIQQTVLNLCTNASDAMDGRGTIVIHTGKTTITQDFVRSRPWARTGSFVFVAIEDRGTGMDEETCHKALSPFFTTKGPGKGTGLGLSSAYGIAKKNNGMIDIQSEPGVGTTVTVYFPEAAVPEPESHTEPSRATQRRPMEGTAIVAEDQPSVRRVTAELVRDLGFQVVEAEDGLEALRAVERLGASLTLVISDSLMPRMGGLELYRKIRTMGLETPFLLCTGESGNIELNEEGGADPFFSWIGKPFDIGEFEAAVRRLFGA